MWVAVTVTVATPVVLHEPDALAVTVLVSVPLLLPVTVAVMTTLPVPTWYRLVVAVAVVPCQCGHEALCTVAVFVVVTVPVRV